MCYIWTACIASGPWSPIEILQNHIDPNMLQPRMLNPWPLLKRVSSLGGQVGVFGCLTLDSCLTSHTLPNSKLSCGHASDSYADSRHHRAGLKYPLAGFHAAHLISDCLGRLMARGLSEPRPSAPIGAPSVSVCTSDAVCTDIACLYIVFVLLGVVNCPFLLCI